jgi:uncharacterized protein YktA (UPF0223 family)
MSQQTAVDWFAENTFNQIELLKRSYVNQEEFLNGMLKFKEQAKKMEKEQIIKSWDNGSETEYQYHVNGEFRRCSFDYYNETYGKQG